MAQEKEVKVMLLIDKQIIELSKAGMVEPFEAKQVKQILMDDGIDRYLTKAISYGVSSAGYDMRMDKSFLIMKAGRIVDPKDPQEDDFEVAELQISSKGMYFLLPPHGFALSSSVEYFRMPDTVMGDVRGKSTNVRSAIHVVVTPLEPGWEGHVTIEIQNMSPSFLKVYALEGIAQVLFHRLHEKPLTTYADKNGKYQGQRGITLGRV